MHHACSYMRACETKQGLQVSYPGITISRTVLIYLGSREVLLFVLSMSFVRESPTHFMRPKTYINLHFHLQIARTVVIQPA